MELTAVSPPSNCRFKSLRFLLTNSKVPRDTKKLVAGVGEKKVNVGSSLIAPSSSRCIGITILIHHFQEPELVNGILNAIQNISDEARRALADPEMPRESLLQVLSVCVLFIVTSPYSRYSKDFRPLLEQTTATSWRWVCHIRHWRPSALEQLSHMG